MKEITNEKVSLNLEDIDQVTGGADVGIRPGLTKEARIEIIRNRVKQRKAAHWDFTRICHSEVVTNQLVSNSNLTEEEIIAIVEEAFGLE